MNTNQNNPIRCRIAPSPTGVLHIGTARTALFNYLFAKHTGGTFVLRIEDTDRERSKPEFEENIIEGLQWLGTQWDEGPIHQSKRTEIYKKYLQQLLDEGKVFACYCQENDEIEKEKESPNQYPREHGDCPDRDNKYNPKDNRSFVIRYKNDAFPEYYAEKKKFMEQNSGRGIFSYPGKISVNFKDIIRAIVKNHKHYLADFIIAKSLDEPLYNFAVVIDDYEMKISHVIRGEDHISNTPKQLLIAEALGWVQNVDGIYKAPWEYAHLPLILGPDRSKLSKRHGATSVNEYREAGYLPDALVNFMALVGWNPGDEREIFSLEELANEFTMGKIQKSGAIFNLEKLDWMNGEYIRKKTADELYELALPYLKFTFPNTGDFQPEYIKEVILLEQPRLKKLSDIRQAAELFFQEPEYDADLLRWKDMSSENLAKSLASSIDIVSALPEKASKNDIERAFLEKIGGGGSKGEILWPLRVALSGQKSSSGPFEIVEILGKEKALQRLQKAKNLL